MALAAPATSDIDTPASQLKNDLLSSTSLVVHPLVLLSVVDHAARAKGGPKKRVVGILLGQDNGKTINVANSFAVPFEEDEKDPKTWFLDHNYIESMYEMFKKVSAKEKLVGWYHSGPRLRSSDLEINEVIKRYCAKPIMVIVDTRNRDVGIPTDGYQAVEEIKDDGTAAQKTFIHIPSTIGAEEAEEIGVEHLLRDIKDLNTGTLTSRVADQLSSLRGLQSRLQEIREYLQQVVAGELPVNHQIIYNLQDAFNLLPNLYGSINSEDSDSQNTFSVATVVTNDQLLVLYLSSLIRAVIALHDLVNNKLEFTSGQPTISSGLGVNEKSKDDSKDDTVSTKDGKKDRNNADERGL